MSLGLLTADRCARYLSGKITDRSTEKKRRDNPLRRKEVAKLKAGQYQLPVI